MNIIEQLKKKIQALEGSSTSSSTGMVAYTGSIAHMASTTSSSLHGLLIQEPLTTLQVCVL